MKSIFPVILEDNLFSFALADMLQQIIWMELNVTHYFTMLPKISLTSLLTKVKPITVRIVKM